MNIKTRILLAVFVIELAGYGILLYHANSQSRETLVDIRSKHIRTVVSENLQRINNLTNLMEHKAIELAHTGQLLYSAHQHESIDAFDLLVEDYLKNSFITFADSIGGGLWYEPFVIDDSKEFYGPYVYFNSRDEVEFTWDLNTPEYNYHAQDWYLTALPKDWDRSKRLDELTYWTAPYWDEAGSKELMMTVDAIMYSNTDKIIGLSTVDWSLKEMTNFIRKINVTENTYTFLIDTNSHKILANELDRSSRMLDYKELSWFKDINIQDIEIGRIYENESILASNEEYILYYLKSDIGLILGVMIPKNEFYMEIDQSAKELITSGAIIIIIFILSMLILLEILFRPFKKVKDLILNSINVKADNTLEVSKVEYEQNNVFTEIIEALNLTYAQINEYTKEVEKSGKAKTTFLTTMSHEIRTPMNGILGYTQLLALDDEIGESHKETLSAIESSGNHLLSLLNDVLDISKIESGAMELHKEDVSLAFLFEEIDSLFKLRCKMEGVTWEFESNIPDNLILYTDGAKIKQIIINLLGNSVKFTNAGVISLSACIKNNLLLLEIKDTGVGISKEHQSELFTPFFQSSAGVEYGGTGLGLTIVKKLTELLEGKVELIESDENGTKFLVSIPADDLEFNTLKQKTKSINTSQKLDPSKFIGKGLKALVVDDVKFNRDILINVLRHMHIESVEAVNGEDALKKMEEFTPDVLFVDIQMPVMDGLGFIKEVKEKYPELTKGCIAISANVYNSDDKYLSQGYAYSLTKPFKIIDVESIIKQLFNF